MSNVTAGKISVQLVADTAKYVDKLKKSNTETNKQLKQMQLQLNKFEKKGKKSFEGVGKSMSSMKASAALAVTALIAVGAKVGSMAAELANAQLQIKAVADSIGLTTAELIYMGKATESVNIDTEKFADIIKDVDDKLGDFVATGAGPFKDIFDKLGGSIGYTAEELSKLSGKDVLVAVQKAMDKANVSAKEQVFYMESLASDSSRLSPLLKDNAKQFNQLANKAKDLTVVLSDGTLAQFNETGATATTTWDNLKGVFAELADDYLPKTQSILEQINRGMRRFVDAAELEDVLSNPMQAATQALKAGDESAHKMQRTLAEMLLASEEGLAAAEATKKANDSTNADRSVMEFSKANIAAKKYKEEVERLTAALTTLQEGRSGGGISLPSTSTKGAAGSADYSNVAQPQHEDELESYKQYQQALKQLNSEYDSYIFQNKLLNAKTNQDYLDVLKEQELSTLKDKYEDQLAEHELFEKAKAEIEAKYQKQKDDLNDIDAEKRLEAESQLEEQKQEIMLGGVDQMGEAFGKQLKFQQTYAKATAAINAILSAVQVWGDPSMTFYEKIPASIAASTAVLSLAGQFHSGSDNVASEGSYLLQKGERVVQPKANKKLTEFLDKGATGGNTTIESNIVMGPSLVDEKVFAQALSRQQSNIAALLKKEESKRPSRRNIRNK